METRESTTPDVSNITIPSHHYKSSKQVNRLKKEDEEEQWISGEELYTDGSSDEEGTKGIRHKHKREHKGARPKERSRSKSDTLPKPALMVPAQDSDNEEPVDISWKPKRGSIKLPHLVKDLDANTSSSSASAEPIVDLVSAPFVSYTFLCDKCNPPGNMYARYVGYPTVNWMKALLSVDLI